VRASKAACGPETRNTPTPPAPGPLATATIVSARSFIASLRSSIHAENQPSGFGPVARFHALDDDPLL
jgi:hypothetical protein